MPSKQAAFAGHVLGRRMSREGRFYHVRFRTGEPLDLVPQAAYPPGLA